MVRRARVARTTGRRHPRSRHRPFVVPLVAVVALAATVVTVTSPAAPAVAEGNEAPGAPLAARSISAGSEHSCAILPSGRLKCWGRNGAGQLGQDSINDLGDAPGEMASLAPVNLGVGRTATAVATGTGNTFTHTCALLDDATVKCWGQNSHGQLGQGHIQRLGDQAGEMAALGPVNLGAGRTATAIATGEQHTCALLDNATVKCWGNNNHGQLGQGNNTDRGNNPGDIAAMPPVNLGAGRTATAIAAGGDITCALLDDATVKCWGDGGGGKLGQGSTADIGEAPGDMAALAPIDLGAGRTATAISAAFGHTCAILDNATVKCWGFGNNGRLGQDSVTDIGDQAGEVAALPAVNLGAGRTATGISAGNGHTCALLDNATVKCWGTGASGQLGQDSTANLGDAPGEMAALPVVDLGAGRTATAVTTGQVHTCARLDDDSTKCWGFNNAGQLGQGSVVNLGDQAGEMAALPSIDLGESMQVGLTADQLLVEPGQDIDYHVTIVNNRLTPLTGITVTDPNAPDCVEPVPDLASGATHVIDCSYTAATTDYPARVNTATVDTAQTTPLASNPVTVSVGHPSPATDISAGEDHTCVVLDDEALKCWGLGLQGRLGQGSTATLGDQFGEMAALPPVNVGAGRTATAVAAGGTHTCALLDNGTVKCWGAAQRLGSDNTFDLGDTPAEMAALNPVNLGVGRTAVAIDAGTAHTCAILDNGSLKCWGLGGSGRLGQDSTAILGDQAGEMAALNPVNLGPGRTATAVSAGAEHTCAVLDNGALKCWGNGANGRLGSDSTATLGDQPGEMAALPTVNLGAGRTATAVAAGPEHTCALLDNATVKCWGNGIFGRLGLDGTATLGDQPGEMAALPTVNLGVGRTATAVSVAHTGHSCALLDNATMKCWGNSSQGQLGQDGIIDRGDDPGEMAALAPINLGAGRTAVAIDTGGGNTSGGPRSCAVLDNGGVKCWGAGVHGALGQESTINHGHQPGSMAALPLVRLGVVPGPASLSVVKTAVQSTVVAGQVIDYEITVTNTGIPGLTGLTLDDPNAPDCEQAIPDLAVGEDHTVDCSYTTTPADVGTFENVATVDSAETAPVASNQVDVDVVLGEVSGTVTETGSGDPVEGAVVAAVTTAGVFTLGTVTDGAGGYSLDLPVGSYKIEFVDPTGRHTGEWHDNTSLGDFGGADPVTVTTPAPVDVDAALAPAGASGRIAGTVTRTGSATPVPGAWVAVLDPTTGAIEASAVAAGDGTYEVEGLEGGSHRVAVLDPSMNHATDLFFDDKADFASADDVVVSPGATTTVNPDLDVAVAPTPNATIAGTVTDSVTSAPIAGAFVAAVNANTGVFTAADEADGSGDYSLAVPAGSYKVEVLDAAGGHYGEWYDDASLGNFAGAAVVTVGAGGSATVDEDLHPSTGSIAGTVTETGSGDPIPGAWVVAVRSTDGAMVAWDTTGGGGGYAIAGLDLGLYRLAVLDPTAAHDLELFFEDRASFATGDDIAVAAGATATINPDLDPAG